MERQSFSNVWDALEDTLPAAANMTMRSNLLIAIELRVRSWGVTQAEAARRLGITQPRLNDLLKDHEFQPRYADQPCNRGRAISVRLDIAEAA